MTNRILLIEDEPNIIEAVGFILSRAGLEVKTHANGNDALEAVRAHAPDLVILDVMLPGRNGFDILQDIRADADLAGLPVLLLTARGQERDRELAARYGASRFMTKPFSNADVLAAVRDMVAP